MADALCIDHHLCLVKVRVFFFDGFEGIQILTHHGCYQLHTGQLGNGVFSYKGPVSQYGDPVTYRIHLFQKVSYKYDRNTFCFQISHQLKEFLHFLVVQRRGGLIQDENLTFHIHSSGNGHHLLDCQRIIF